MDPTTLGVGHPLLCTFLHLKILKVFETIFERFCTSKTPIFSRRLRHRTSAVRKQELNGIDDRVSHPIKRFDPDQKHGRHQHLRFWVMWDIPVLGSFLDSEAPISIGKIAFSHPNLKIFAAARRKGARLRRGLRPHPNISPPAPSWGLRPHSLDFGSFRAHSLDFFGPYHPRGGVHTSSSSQSKEWIPYGRDVNQFDHTSINTSQSGK